MEYSIIEKVLATFYSTWTDTKPTRTIAAAERVVTSHSVRTDTNQRELASSDTKINRFTLLPPEVTQLLNSVYLSALDSCRLGLTCHLFKKVFASLLFSNTKDIKKLPATQEIPKNLPLLFIEAGKLVSNELESAETAQEELKAYTQRKREEFLPWSQEGLKDLKTQGLDGYLIKHQLASGNCSISSLKANYDKHYEHFKNNISERYRENSEGFKTLFNYVLIGWDVSTVTGFSIDMKECLCFEAMQQAVADKKITPQDVKEKNGTDLLAALNCWSKIPPSQEKLTFSEVFNHPKHALFLMQNSFIRKAISEGKLEKSTFFSWSTTVIEVLDFPTVKKGLVARNFTFAQVEKRAVLLSRPFHPVGNHHYHNPHRPPSSNNPSNLEFYAKAAKFSCVMAYYFERNWANKLTLEDCLNADPAKLEILLADDDGYIAGLVTDKIITVKELLALDERRLALLVFQKKGEYWQKPRAIQQLESKELTVNEFKNLELSELTRRVVKNGT